MVAAATIQTTENSTKKGAFGAHPGHDAHILSTLSAIQVLATHDDDTHHALSRINKPRVVDCASSFSPFYIYIHMLMSIACLL